MFEYLKTLPLTDAQKADITKEGYENAQTLLLLCKLAPTMMKEWFEVDSLDELENALANLLTEAEKAEVDAEVAYARTQ